MPSSKQLAAELADMARDIYIGEEELTVNLVRQRVEQKLGLDEGFFQEDNWKRKSRQIIKQTLVRTPFRTRLECTKYLTDLRGTGRT
jgi:hypothetical protein